jgi:aspartokinase
MTSCAVLRHAVLYAVQSNVVYKFGGSSVRDAERMREVADIICSFPQYLPCVVLSAMGKVGTANRPGVSVTAATAAAAAVGGSGVYSLF